MVRQVLRKELGLKIVEVEESEKATVEGGDVLWTGEFDKLMTFYRWQFKVHLLENRCILMQFSLKCVSKVPIDSESALVKVMTLRQSGNKPEASFMIQMTSN